MPFAIVHFLATAAVMRLSGLRLSGTRGRFLGGRLGARELFLCAFIGLLPDLDMVVQLVSWNLLKIPFWPHRLFTHNLIIPVILLAIGWCIYISNGNEIAWKVFFLASAAWCAHVMLDLVFMGPVRLLAPISWARAWGLLRWEFRDHLFIAVDAILLVGWLFFRMYGSNRKAVCSL
jgi:membrane-bound metal-dependent hydrolase YbcI (DUF457 family)